MSQAPPAPARVLVVDDDERRRAPVVRALESVGLIVDTADDGSVALGRLSPRPDLVVLELSSRDGEGLFTVDALSVNTDAPVLALADDPDIGARALDHGADAYAVRPVSTEEVVARARALLRRTVMGSGRLEYEGLAVDRAMRQVLVNGVVVATTALEFRLLDFLASHPRQVFSRDDLLREVWPQGSVDRTRRTVTEHVRRLRRKIEAEPARPRWVKTVRGFGYRFDS